MKKCSLIVFTLLALCLIHRPAAFSQRTLKRAIPVTTTIDGGGIISDPTIFNYRLQSDLLGSYRGGADSVVSELQTGGDWQLDTVPSPNRKLMLDFRDAVTNGNPSAPFSTALVPAKVETKSYLLYGNGKVAGMTGLNSTLITPLLVRFDFNGNSYRVWMNSQNYPETNDALITCTGVADPTKPSTSQCIQWRIEPTVTQADGQKKNVARLIRFYTSKGKEIEENHGDFYMAFSIGFTNP
jgi:hypothetical protein